MTQADPGSSPPPGPADSDRARRSYRRLGRDAAVYGLGTVASRFVSFVMLPIYTRFLTTADYGLLQILDLSLDVAAIIVSAGTTAGVMRFYYKAEREDDRRAVLFTAFLTLALLNAVGTAILFAGAPFIRELALSGAGTDGLVRLAALNFTLNTLGTVPLLMLQADQKPGLVVTASISKLVLQVGLNILFVVGFRWGPLGVLLSTFFTSVIIGGSLATMLVRRTGFRFSWPVFRDIRRFGVPYQFTQAGTFVLAYGDRFFLEKTRGLAEVGIYGLAYQFGFLLTSAVAGPFMQAWSPQRHQLLGASAEERTERTNRGLLYASLLVVSAAVLMAVFITPVIHVMAAPPFHRAATFVPVILAAYVFQVWSNVTSFGIVVSERTIYQTISTWISVAVVLVLYAVMIPPWGGMGAAVATLVAFALRFGLTTWFAQRLYPLPYRWGGPLRLAAWGTLVVLLYELIVPEGLLPQLATGSAAFVLYAGLVWRTVLDPEDRERLGVLLRAPRNLKAFLAGS